MLVNGVQTGMVSIIMQKALNIIPKDLQPETPGFFEVAAVTANPGLHAHPFALPVHSLTDTIIWGFALPEHLKFFILLILWIPVKPQVNCIVA